MVKLLKLLLFILFSCACLLWVGHFLLEHNSAIQLSQVLMQYHWAFTLWRYGLYAVCILLWPYFIKYLGLRQKWPPERVAYLSQQRLKLLGFFILIEVFFVYNLVGHLITWL